MYAQLSYNNCKEDVPVSIKNENNENYENYGSCTRLQTHVNNSFPRNTRLRVHYIYNVHAHAYTYVHAFPYVIFIV